jgi:hypothetical protein
MGRIRGLGLEDRVPDARTIWLFREKLATAGAIKRLFEQFDAMLRHAGYIAMSGQIVDASLSGGVPAQYGRREEGNQTGRIPANWKAKPAKLRQDRDVDGQIQQGQTARGWLDAASRSSNPAIWLSEPCFDRSPSSADAATDADL